MGISISAQNIPFGVRPEITNIRLSMVYNNNLVSMAPAGGALSCFISNQLPPGFSCWLTQKGTGSITVTPDAGVTIITGATATNGTGQTIKIICIAPGEFIAIHIGGSGTSSGGTETIKISQANFTGATAYNNAAIVGKTLIIFWNNIPRYLDEGIDYTVTGTGINIIVPGFDATVNPYSFIINYSTPIFVPAP